MRILFVCTGNQCSSPMARALREWRLEELGLGDRICVDSAGTGYYPNSPATFEAQRAIEKVCRKDLLMGHHAKHISDNNSRDFDLILTWKRRIRKIFRLKKPSHSKSM
jgi:protein-tyrosine phosphatase